ncbi:hypothetical protein [Nocardioides flavescens]|uniref:Uncharacterized protein n=1 Tax=Nocardioides flavescens TaxID=2691959 RepID=A0A6L7EWM4_9ACTN|nr:hypothetical protein [Nocardioides flavescens]MXG88419.1 hypothetical protein [Nocardioides flavescens]
MLPELHPLLYEWYFTGHGAEVVAEHARGAGSRWLTVGTPSVASALVGTPGSLALIDANDAVTLRFPNLVGAAQVLIGEVAAVIGRALPSDVVIVDPPWYLADVQRWLSLASQQVDSGGTIITTLFPELTRPSAGRERDNLLAACQRLGRVELRTAAVTYRTPRFELEALKALQLPDPGDWRVADLLIIRDVQRPAAAVAPDSASFHRGLVGWERFVIGPQVVFLSQRHSAADAPASVVPIVSCPGHVLTSVSERDSRRALVSVWTSRNRVATVLDPLQVRGWLQALARGEPAAVTAAAQKRADAQLLLDLIAD